MKKLAVQTDQVDRNTTVSACEKSAQWERTHSILAEMEGLTVQADHSGCSAAISVSEKSAQWEWALKKQAVQVGTRSCEATTSTCEKGAQWEGHSAFSQGWWRLLYRQVKPATVSAQHFSRNAEVGSAGRSH